MSYNELASQESVTKAIVALQQNGFLVSHVASGIAAKAELLKLIPQGSQVMTMTSMTLEAIGVAQEINSSDKYISVREQISQIDGETHKQQKLALGAVPEWVIGSVHAVTENGEALVASATGSQLPAYAYGAQHVVWVVGTQKIVSNIEAGMKRIYEHSLPLESERAHKAYGVAASSVNKILITNKEPVAGRTTIILVDEVLGF